jgi:hypothetical protein
MKADDKFDWTKQLDTLTDNYNNSINTTTNERPDDVETFKNYDNVKEHTKKKLLGNKPEETVRFNKGDKVRIKLDNTRDKTNFSKDIYTIQTVGKPHNKVSTPFYFLKELEGKYYNNDLIKIDTIENETKEQPEIFNISRVVKPIMRNHVKSYEIQWTGYKETTIEPRNELMKDIPKMINQYDKKHKVKWLKNNVMYED